MRHMHILKSSIIATTDITKSETRLIMQPNSSGWFLPTVLSHIFAMLFNIFTSKQMFSIQELQRVTPAGGIGRISWSPRTQYQVDISNFRKYFRKYTTLSSYQSRARVLSIILWYTWTVSILWNVVVRSLLSKHVRVLCNGHHETINDKVIKTMLARHPWHMPWPVKSLFPVKMERPPRTVIRAHFIWYGK